MALQKTTIHVPLGKLDMGSDAHSIKLGDFAIADNVCIDQEGRYRPRGKWTGLAGTVLGRATVHGPAADILGYGDNLAIRTRDGEVLGYSKSLSKWSSVGWMPRSSLRSDVLRSDPTLRNANTEIMDSCVANNQLWVVYSTETTLVSAGNSYWTMGGVYVSCYDLGTSSDATPGVCMLNSYEVTAAPWTLNETWGSANVGAAPGQRGALPHLTKCSLTTADDTVVLTTIMQATSGSECYLVNFDFQTASPATAPTLQKSWWITNATSTAVVTPYDVIEVPTTGSLTDVLIAGPQYGGGGSWANVVTRVHMADDFNAITMTGGRPNIGLHWLARSSAQTGYATLAASGTGATGCITGLWLNKINLSTLAVHSSTGAQKQITTSTTVQRMTGWSENLTRDVIVYSAQRLKQYAVNTAIETTAVSQTYNTTTTTSLDSRWNIWPVSRSFQRHASTTYNDWSFWVVYVGENMPSSTGALGTGIYDLQQTYFCCHGSTETATYKPSLFDIIAKCHHDQALVTVSGLYKTTNAFGGASWVTSVPRVRLSRLGYRPITTMVLPREMDLANNDYTAVTLPSYSAMAAVRVDWDPEDLSDPVYHGKTATLPGGIVDVYNERSIADSGFVLRPEVPGLTASAGGSVTVGTHGCVVCWISRDNEGNLWRSAPSSPNTITIANPNNTLNVHVQTPGINDERILTAEIYLTQAGGSLYYLAGTLSVPYIGAAPGTSPVVSTAITLADAALASKQTLYTDSGELPHDVTPSASVLVQWRNRVWAACGEDRDAVRFSEELQEDTGINWSDSYEVDMPGGDGDVTGLAPFGDRLYIFKRRAIYALAGDGPDSTGNGAYPQPEQIVHGIGCVAQRSIVVLPEGVMFGAETGIFMVDGGGRVSEVGAAVNADLRGIFGQGQPVRISGAAIVPNTDLVAFAPAASGGSIRTVTPTIYVFDRKRGAWFTWSADLSSSYASSSAAVAANQDSLFFCDGNSSANGLVMVYSHALAPQYDTPTINRKFDTTWKTGWFSLPATGDEVRLYEVHGRFKLGNGTDTYQMDWTIETDVASGTSSYGVQSQLVTSTITGTRSDYHFTAVVRPKYQKGDRFRITITGFSPIIPTHTGAIELIGIDLIVGAKGGLQRVPVGNIATT